MNYSWSWELVPLSAIQLTAAFLGPGPTTLLEEEDDAKLLALIAKLCTCSMFSGR